MTGGFSPDLLTLDAGREVERIAQGIREALRGPLRRRGLVIGLSGGIDSSVAAALAVNALGPQRVFGLLMPETDSSDDSLRLGRLLAEWLGVAYTVEDIAPALEAAGCYRRRDDAIRQVVPEYGPGYRSKLVLPPLQESRYRLTEIVVARPDGTRTRTRLTAEAYRQIVAATNFKQRVRKMFEYYHADRLNYAVVGTPNRLEYDQGFFVKNGDGSADVKPIAHLYKAQVYQLAEALGVPDEIRQRPPTTDTFSLPQTQEEFYFSVPLRVLDMCLYAKDHGFAPSDVAAATGVPPAEVAAVFEDIESKRAVARYLHMAPVVLS